ncbi:small RNA degrading nuclease 3 [Euphorbia peplus]|nr:small RNA degrading nuclease 3 [Euphorbia peplus]
MEDELVTAISTLPQKVLVDIVKLAQKQERQGDKGGWKDFLNVFDTKIGSSLSDPSRRTRETLLAFILSFTQIDDLKFLDHYVRSHFNREVIKQIRKESSVTESPQQRLVRLTSEHPYYPSKYTFPSHDTDWVVTKLPKKSKLMNSSEMIAIDCEMVLCEDGTDALVRVCVVDQNLQVKLDEKVKPFKPVEDYRTEITGISAADLDGVSYSLTDIQKSMKKLLKKGTILVGHGLHNDLQALKLDHAIVIDTSFIFSHVNGRAPSLSSLCKSVLGYELRNEGAPHNCVDDANAAMRLVLAKIEHGVDNELLLKEEDVLEDQMAKLMIHGIPIDVLSKELHGIFPEKFTLEIKPPRKAKGVQYSAHAIFKNPQVAQRAFESLNGRLEKDKNGLLQKVIKLDLESGSTVNVYVRKMGHDHMLDQVSTKKRAMESEDLPDAKKLKTDESGDHLKEIERLKQQLKNKDTNACDDHLIEIERLKKDLSAKSFQISTQDKMISNLRKELLELKKKKK